MAKHKVQQSAKEPAAVSQGEADQPGLLLVNAVVESGYCRNTCTAGSDYPPADTPATEPGEPVAGAADIQSTDTPPADANDLLSPVTDILNGNFVDVVPVQCKHCKQINCSTVKNTYTLPNIVYQVAGVRYRGARWQYRYCTACKKRFTTRTPLEILQ